MTIGNPLKGLVPNPRWWSPPYASNLPVSLVSAQRILILIMRLDNIDAICIFLTPYIFYIFCQLQEFTYVGVDEVMFADPDVVGVEQAFDWTALEVAMNNTAGRNKHVVPRFHLHYPGEPLRVPQYLLDAGIELRYHDNDVSPYYGDEKLLYAIEQFLKAYGDKYDGDKRIAFVQVGMIGFWGEHHTFPYDEFLPDPVKDLMIQLHRENFNKTQVQSREPRDWALRENIGFHDDSFGHSTLDGEANGGKEESWFFWPEINAIDGSNFWRTSVMGCVLCVCRMPCAVCCHSLTQCVSRHVFPAGRLGQSFSLQSLKAVIPQVPNCIKISVSVPASRTQRTCSIKRLSTVKVCRVTS